MAERNCGGCTHWRRGHRKYDRTAAAYVWDADGAFGSCYGGLPVATAGEDREPFPYTWEDDRCPYFMLPDVEPV